MKGLKININALVVIYMPNTFCASSMNVKFLKNIFIGIIIIYFKYYIYVLYLPSDIYLTQSLPYAFQLV